MGNHCHGHTTDIHVELGPSSLLELWAMRKDQVQQSVPLERISKTRTV